MHPFEDPSSLEFFAAKNDASLLVFGHHSKKRPHCLTFVRCFNAKILDLLELYIDPDSLRTLQQFKNTKCAVGLKPLLAFSGTLFESPTPNAYTLAKNLFLDYFGGHEAATVDVEGLQYLMQFCVGDEVDGQPAPKIHFRVFLIRTKKSGQKLPRVEVEEMGPRIDFRVGRIREAEESVWREALKKPKHIEVRRVVNSDRVTLIQHYTQPKVKKNIDTDIIGDKVGRIHIGKQNLSTLQTRKMKGLKRTRDAVDDDNSMLIGDEDGLNESNAKRERR